MDDAPHAGDGSSKGQGKYTKLFAKMWGGSSSSSSASASASVTSNGGGLQPKPPSSGRPDLQEQFRVQVRGGERPGDGVGVFLWFLCGAHHLWRKWYQRRDLRMAHPPELRADVCN